jgi:hypothetical protein
MPWDRLIIKNVVSSKISLKWSKKWIWSASLHAVLGTVFFFKISRLLIFVGLPSCKISGPPILALFPSCKFSGQLISAIFPSPFPWCWVIVGSLLAAINQGSKHPPPSRRRGTPHQKWTPRPHIFSKPCFSLPDTGLLLRG